ncbi:hypothetical protein BDF14DRAFT_1779997 [Spinellus fusiger]|nr:hypothetical protein BDF14DRAFT_1779997 [Spinellus fusiger]
MLWTPPVRCKAFHLPLNPPSLCTFAPLLTLLALLALLALWAICVKTKSHPLFYWHLLFLIYRTDSTASMIKASHMSFGVSYGLILLCTDYGQVTVLYFAAVRDITCQHSQQVTLPKDSSLTHLTTHLLSLYGEPLAKLLETCLYAVNMDYIEKEKEVTTLLTAGDEVAIIPPVSGG